ncbi:hypothetical protein CEXT_423501 [Caerostris extrusa]|uniref:Uncharacterized protein n=1 Tax=Caerostris extrusa TaxID=172846 RepID=A0AAV4V4S7_CAEEX|nr:hypothetical protein CEXT_423501 [Caerostris extrusa]
MNCPFVVGNRERLGTTRMVGRGKDTAYENGATRNLSPTIPQRTMISEGSCFLKNLSRSRSASFFLFCLSSARLSWTECTFCGSLSEFAVVDEKDDHFSRGSKSGRCVVTAKGEIQ